MREKRRKGLKMLLSLLRKNAIKFEKAMNEVPDKKLFVQYLQKRGYVLD